MKTTARTLISLIALLGCLQVTSTSAGPLSYATEAVLGPVATTQASPAKDLSETEKRSRSDDLLRRARQAMSEGRLDVAEHLAGQAEALGARYNPLNPISDTPTKLQRDLARKQAAVKGKSKGRPRFFPTLPFGKKQDKKPASDPFKAAPAKPSQVKTGKVMPLPPVNAEATSPAAVLAKAQAAKKQSATGSEPGFAQVGTTATNATPAVIPATTNPVASTGSANGDRTESDNLILNARRALALGDVKRANKLITQAKEYRVSYGPSDDTPFLVETAVKKYADLKAQEPTRKGTKAYRRSTARLMMEQAVALLKWNDFDEAERLANQAAAQRVSFSPVETNPQLLLDRIAKSRLQARSPGTASGVVQASVNVAAPATGAAPNSHQAARAYYNPASDKTRNVPAAYQPMLAQNTRIPAPPRPLPPANPNSANPAAANPQASAENLGMKLYQQGEAALRAGDGKKAMDFFQKAAVYQNQLDPLTAQRLQDHLQLLSRPNAAAPTRTLAQDATAKQQILARQVLSDIMRKENQAAKLRESDPAGGLKILEESRAAVEKAGLESTARTALLTRVDRGIAEMKQFIDDNRARIELTDRNREVLAAIDRDKKHKFLVQDKLGELVEQFNQKMEEQSYAEAEIIAKRAVELSPDNVTAQQLLLNAKFIRRFKNNQALIASKESGFIDAMHSVEVSSTPFDDSNPYVFAKGWDELTKRRAKLLEKYRPARSERELEIEQKLKTPVSVSFDGAPLSVVLDQLAQLAQVNLFLDPQG
ncbi:MAG: hypothetical protein U9N87_07200, partial [Planctomycetota bacterium]|nr:hypothetical protein [Planctomycetota bacterium]